MAQAPLFSNRFPMIVSSRPPATDIPVPTGPAAHSEAFYPTVEIIRGDKRAHEVVRQEQ